MTRRRIAIVGSGIAGLTAGYVLSRTDDVTVFEAEQRLGGHAHTHQVAGPDGRDIWVDSGFIVHNRETYPLLTRLFSELGVAVQDSEMSMSVSCAGCGLAYAGQRGLAGLAVGLPRGGLRYARMLGEVLRFHRSARRLLASSTDPRLAGQGATVRRFTGPRAAGADISSQNGAAPAHLGPDEAGPLLGEFLAAGHYSPYFITHFALPFVAAVWSCPPQTALRYPARYLFAFLRQHGLLTVTGSPPWRTVAGGSRSYVERVAKQLASVRTGARVTAVTRPAPGAAGPAARALVSYADPDGARTEGFDAIVLATHPDQALRVLADPTPDEREVLGAFRYSRNETVLHTDGRVLPASPRVRASWNYALPSCAPDSGQVRVSYDMNRLQRLPGERPFVVTLNGDVPAEHVIARMDYEHPVYDTASVAAQRRLAGLNDGVTAYAGAYHGWGFHEDGCRSGVAAAESLGGRW
jgi:predicted NAD/FAD-binding protein